MPEHATRHTGTPGFNDSPEGRSGRNYPEGGEGIFGMCLVECREMRLGSPDVRLVVETATNTCKMSIHRLQSALAIDKTESVFAKSYLDTIIENTKTEAMVLVLKGNAKDARIRAVKQE
jgi:hypothetical protein